jgi:hypothetical protein
MHPHMRRFGGAFFAMVGSFHAGDGNTFRFETWLANCHTTIRNRGSELGKEAPGNLRGEKRKLVEIA